MSCSCVDRLPGIAVQFISAIALAERNFGQLSKATQMVYPTVCAPVPDVGGRPGEHSQAHAAIT